MIAEKTISFDWKFVSESYVDAYEQLDVKFDRIYSKSAHALCKMAKLQRRQTVVELGCGTGTSTGATLTEVSTEGRIFAIDINPRMLNRAQSEFRFYKNVTFIHDDMSNLLEKMNELELIGKVDCIFSSFSYFYVYDFHEALQEDMFKVLRPGGCLTFNIGTFLRKVEYNGQVYNDT